MKRFLMFAGSTYYPGGGWDDFAGWFNTYIEAEAHFRRPNSHDDWFQVIDTQTWEPYSE